MQEDGFLSKLRFYSLGLVAANKPLSSPIIEVLPTEDFPMVNGEVTDNIDKYKSTSKDASGAVTSVVSDTTPSVKAEWLPMSNSNRRTAPDVRRGETVVLYKFGDTDKYWWQTMINDHKLRRLETVIYAFSDNRLENVEDTATSTYFLEISTHTKVVHLHTSKSDGEPFTYDVQINAKEGIITITDDAENFFILNSRDKRITLQNGDLSIVDINKRVIDIFAADKVNVKSDQINLTAENDINITAKKGISVKAGGAFNFNADTTVGTSSSTISISSPNTSID